MTLEGQRTATDDDSDRLHVEFGRFLCDDRPSASGRVGSGKSQESRGVDGWTATGLDAASRMRQADHAESRFPPRQSSQAVLGILNDGDLNCSLMLTKRQTSLQA